MLAELRETTEEKIVVVSNFTATLDLIEKHCKCEKYPYCRLDGYVRSDRLCTPIELILSPARRKTPQQDRIPMVDAFNKGSHKNNCASRRSCAPRWC